MRLTRRGTIAYARSCRRSTGAPEAVEVLDRAFGPNPDAAMAELRRQLAAGAPVPYGGITSAREGVAETAFSIAGALNGEAADAYTLVYARIAQYLDPEHVDALLLVASLLDHSASTTSRRGPMGRCPRTIRFHGGRDSAAPRRCGTRATPRAPSRSCAPCPKAIRDLGGACGAGRHAAPRGALRRGDAGLRPRHRALRGRGGVAMGRLLLARDHARARGPLARGRGRLPQGAGACARPAAGAELPRLFDRRDCRRTSTRR
jgi:hypothetical protein